MPTIEAGSGDDLRKHFGEQAYQPHLRTDNTISFMDATKLKQPISSVRPAQSTFQPRITAVACNLRCHYGKDFPNESDLQIHIQNSHVPQFVSQMNTVNASKGQEFTELIGPVGSDKESSIIDASKSNPHKLGVAPAQSSVQAGMTTVVGKQSCGQSGQLFMDKIHHHIQIQEEHNSLQTVNAGKCDDSRRTNLVQHQVPVKPDNRSLIIDAVKMTPSMSGVEPMQSSFQPGMATVAGNQGYKHCEQNFANKALLQIHIQDSHMEQFTPQLSTVTLSNRQKLTEHFGKAQEATHKFVNKNPVVVLEDSRANVNSSTQSVQQSCFSLESRRNADVGNQRGNLCTQTMIDDSSPDSNGITNATVSTAAVHSRCRKKSGQ